MLHTLQLSGSGYGFDYEYTYQDHEYIIRAMNTKQEQHLASLLQAAHKIAVSLSHVLATSFAGLCCFLA